VKLLRNLLATGAVTQVRSVFPYNVLSSNMGLKLAHSLIQVRIQNWPPTTYPIYSRSKTTYRSGISNKWEVSKNMEVTQYFKQNKIWVVCILVLIYGAECCRLRKEDERKIRRIFTL